MTQVQSSESGLILSFMVQYLGLIILLSTIFGCSGDNVVATDECPEYQVIEDHKDTQIVSITSSAISEAELKCVLIKIADTHQYDTQRDYLMMDYLWVTVYLKRGEKVSSVPAGRLGRFVPINQTETVYVDGNNEFHLSLSRAIESF